MRATTIQTLRHPHRTRMHSRPTSVTPASRTTCSSLPSEKLLLASLLRFRQQHHREPSLRPSPTPSLLCQALLSPRCDGLSMSPECVDRSTYQEEYRRRRHRLKRAYPRHNRHLFLHPVKTTTRTTTTHHPRHMRATTRRPRSRRRPTFPRPPTNPRPIVERHRHQPLADAAAARDNLLMWAGRA